MPTYKVTDRITGKTLKLTGDSPPTEQELTDIFSQYQQPDNQQQGRNIADIPESEFTPKNVAMETIKGTARDLFKGAPELLTGKTALQRSQEAPVDTLIPMTGNKVTDKLSLVESFFKGLDRDISSTALDMATSPSTVITGGLSKVKNVADLATKAGKTVAGTKLGKGFGKIFNSDLGKVYARSRPDYLVNEVAPQAHKVFQKNVNEFTPEISNYAKNKLKIPDQAIKDIKNFGTDNIIETSNKYGNSTDIIFQKIEQGFNNKEQIANNFYQNVMANAPKNKSININSSINQAGNVLKKIGLINKNGNLTEAGQAEIMKDSVYSKLLDFYKSADSLSGVKYIKAKGATGDLTINQGSKLLSSRFNTNVNKEQYTFLRDKLNTLWKGKPSDVDVSKVINQFYQDGETSGIKGLQEARRRSKMVFDMKKRFETSQGDLKALLQEKSLDRYYNQSQENIRKLKEAEKYIEMPVVDDLKKVTASRYLSKIMEGKSEKDFTALIEKASNPKYTIQVRNELKDIIGQKEADKIIKEVIANRRLRTASGLAGKVATGSAIGAGIKIGHDALENF